MYNFTPEDFPGAKACDQNTMGIPLHNQMTAEDYEYTINTLRKI